MLGAGYFAAAFLAVRQGIEAAVVREKRFEDAVGRLRPRVAVGAEAVAYQALVEV